MSVAATVAAMSCAGCGMKKSEDAPKEEKTAATAPVTSKDTAKSGPIASPEPAEKTVRTLKLLATLSEAVEKFGPFSLEVGIGKSGAVAGTFTVGADKLRLSGTVREGEVRMWATPDTAETLRGGFFVGTEKDGTASGTFSLSGNAGSPSLRGTWKTQ